MIEPVQIFPSLLFRSFFVIDDNVRCDIIDELKSKKDVTLSANSPLGNYTDFYKDSSIINHPILKDLKEFILNEVKCANTFAGFLEPVNYLNSWFGIIEKYGYHEAHTHPDSLWSAVYYLQATQTDAPICFLNKNIIDTGGWGMGVAAEKNQFNSSQISVLPETGMLLIFPSYLLHKVDQQKTDSERIMIAMNFSNKQHGE